MAGMKNLTVAVEENCPVQIVSREDKFFELNEWALEKILLQDDVKDKPVAVISVAGAFRKGKSFLLNFCLRYLKRTHACRDISCNWLGQPDEPLEGFSWRGGSERDTTGILMWSEVFVASLPSGEEAAVILLDTQGTFDSGSTVKDCATVFALSTLISSVQVYNLSQNIQEDDLQHLQLFTEYGRLALAESGKTPFQKLLFLVRDWSFPYEAKFGAVGGKKILDKRLETSDEQDPELRSIRKHIRSCFSEILCFLMPHPGLQVATNRSFDGRLSDVECTFRECLETLVPLLLAPENLTLKKINGQKVLARELFHYFKAYMSAFDGDALPQPKSMLVATAEANNLAAVADAKESYQKRMEEICGGSNRYLNPAHLQTEHNRLKAQVLEGFSNKRKMGGEQFSQCYKAKLDSDLEEMYSHFVAHNETKNLCKSARTPTICVLFSAMFYFLSGVLGFVGLHSLSNLSTFLMYLWLATLLTWTYTRLSGEMAAVSDQIDSVAAFFWENVLIPFTNRILHKSVSYAVQASTSSSYSSPSTGTQARL